MICKCCKLFGNSKLREMCNKIGKFYIMNAATYTECWVFLAKPPVTHVAALGVLTFLYAQLDNLHSTTYILFPFLTSAHIVPTWAHFVPAWTAAPLHLWFSLLRVDFDIKMDKFRPVFINHYLSLRFLDMDFFDVSDVVSV